MPGEKVICDKADLVNIANAIRTLTGSSSTYKPSELASQVTLIAPSSLDVSHDGEGNVTVSLKIGVV